MKKFLSLVAVMAVAVMMSSTAWAASLATKSARATFAAAALTFDVSLYHWGGSGNYETQSSTGTIGFDASDVTIGSTENSFAISPDFAVINSNLNQQPANTTVYVYTDNKNNSSDFVAVSSGTGDGFNGLVRKGQGSTYKAGDYATIITKCVKISSANANISGGPKTATFDMDSQSSGDRWLADKSTTGFTNDANIIGKGGVGGGIYVGSEYSTTETNWYSTEKVVMFFRATFNNVNGGDEYGTDTIKFGQVVE